MNHSQILRKITSKGKLYKKLVETIEKDVAILRIFSDGDIRALFNRF